MPEWLDIANDVRYCKCEKDSVRIDMDLFTKRLRGEPIEEPKSPSKAQVRKMQRRLAKEAKDSPEPKEGTEPSESPELRKRDSKKQRKDDEKDKKIFFSVI